MRECLKYYCDEERKINDNVKPFTKLKCHFANARFFEKDDASKETMLSTISSTGKGGTKKYPLSTKGRHLQTTAQEGAKQIGRPPSLIKQAEKKVTTFKRSTLTILRYSLNLKEKMKSSFNEYTIPKDTTKADIKRSKINWVVLVENDILAVHKAHYIKLTKVRLPVFITSSTSKATYQGCTQVMGLIQMHINDEKVWL